MGLFDIFKKNDNRQYVTEKQFNENINRQQDLGLQTLEKLRNIGVTDDKVEKLSNDLSKLGYEVQFRHSQGDNKLFISNGWALKMKMDEYTVTTWTKEMWKSGYKFDCDFDGWVRHLIKSSARTPENTK